MYECPANDHDACMPRLLTQLTADRRTSFENQAFPALESGLLSFQAFCEVTGMTAAEARAYGLERGLDASKLD